MNETEQSVDREVGAMADEAFEGACEAAVEGDRPDVSEEMDEGLRERIEQEALAAVFDDVRAQSSDGKLVEPVRWEEEGFVPEHMTAEEFEMFVYEYLEESAAARELETEAEEAPVARTATKAVGVPRFKRPKEPTEEQVASEEAAMAEGQDERPEPVRSEARAGVVDEQAAQAMAEGRLPEALVETAVPLGSEPEEDGPFEPFEMTVGGKRGVVTLVEGEPTFVPYAPGEAPSREVDCENVAVLVGAHSYYLYARDRMTDAFARWSFLSKEDSDVATLVECAREESRTYPRPMPASSLRNEPFCLDDERIEAAWKAVEESGDFPDMETVVASNGDRYFFSTDHISRAYAESLAEWASVERFMNV